MYERKSVMKISDIKAKQILPFEIDNIKLIRLFSFYLHSAPTVESRTATKLDEQRLLHNWKNFICQLPQDKIKFYSESYSVDEFINSLGKFGLNDDADINRQTKAMVCKRKDKSETDCSCLLRHIRNSIAHNNLYLSNAGNRKFILFEDFNTRGNITARILLSQTDLTKLKKEIMR